MSKVGAWLSQEQRRELQSWLEAPNGAIWLEDAAHKTRAIFEAIEGGGIVVKAEDW